MRQISSIFIFDSLSLKFTCFLFFQFIFSECLYFVSPWYAGCNILMKFLKTLLSTLPNNLRSPTTTSCTSSLSSWEMPMRLGWLFYVYISFVFAFNLLAHTFKRLLWYFTSQCVGLALQRIRMKCGFSWKPAGNVCTEIKDFLFIFFFYILIPCH